MDQRHQFLLEYGRCMVCGDGWRFADYFPKVLDPHEIARGPARRKAVDCPAAWLVLCRQHHEEMGDYSVWPVVAQLALKRLRDPEHYDRQAVNLLRGRAPEAITDAEVDAAEKQVVSRLRALGFLPI